jgi:hypothetical protein
MTNKTPPNGYFDATKLLMALKHRPKQAKVSQFYDNRNLQPLLITLDMPILSEVGRGGYTWLRDELRPDYDHWLNSVGTKSASNYDKDEV